MVLGRSSEPLRDRSTKSCSRHSSRVVLLNGIWTAHWLYWTAPLLGAALAVAANHVPNHVLSPAKPLETRPGRAQEPAPEEEPT